MDINQIRRRLEPGQIPAIAQATGLSERTLFRIKAGADNITLATLGKLQCWAKGRRPKKTRAR